ncbi:hypothetical protein F511_30298 [Dorcoceras hygrometricum]|uniref:Uncharacterized protein n=1 Tax=Dorcoceras hygrometricum TaxID=472368 RepID=A0A2Z7CJ82_9LAMI|nr:hypothetical protein F511_30298 [Dorcoceras hygrometricum]
MSTKCFNAPELVKEDLLCYFGFSRKRVELVGDLADRMGKAAMLKSLKGRQEQGEGFSGTFSSQRSSKGKRKVLQSGEKEARRQNKKRASTPKERPLINPEAPSIECKPTKELRFRSRTRLDVDQTVKPLKGQFPRGTRRSQAPSRQLVNAQLSNIKSHTTRKCFYKADKVQQSTLAISSFSMVVDCFTFL